jgi:uncharacterized protein (UPF0332 family)
MNGRDFLTVARLLSAGSTEASWRSAISRAYYAAFHISRDLLEALGFTVPFGDQAHAYLYRRLQNCGHPLVASAGMSLDRLRSERNRADYDLHRPVTQTSASSQIVAAERIILAFDSAVNEPTRTQVTDGIKNYERNVLRQVTWKP